MTPEAFAKLWRGRCRHRILARWECEALELYREHKGLWPVHYWLHRTKCHYRRRRGNT